LPPLPHIVLHVDNVFDGGGTPSSFHHGPHCRGLVVSLPLLSSRGGVPLDPNGNDDENDEDNKDEDKDNDNDQC